MLEFGLVILGVWLAFQIITEGMAAHYGDDKPAQAVLWRPDSAEPLAVFAQQRLAAGDIRRGAELARRALAESPLNVRALSTYGFALAKAGQWRRADEVMTLAGQRGWRDGLTQAWLFARRTAQGRYDEAFQRADALLRRAPELQPRLFPAITLIVEQKPQALPFLIRRLQEAPSWRPAYLASLSSDPKGQGVALQLLQGLSAGPTPPTRKDLAPYVSQLVAHRQYIQAVQTWRRFIRAPVATSLINDGGFEGGPSDSPMGWMVANDEGANLAFVAAPGGARGTALRVEYDGFSTPQFTRQLMALAPGSYRLAGRVYPGTDQAVGRLSWRVVCADDGRALGRASADSAATARWSNFGATFEVPGACAGQWLQLAADAGDRRSDIVVFYDDLSVVDLGKH